MKATRILLRLMVLSAGLILLSIPRPFVAQGSGCGGWYEYSMTQCSCSYYEYPIFSKYHAGMDVLQSQYECVTDRCPIYVQNNPVYNFSACCTPNGNKCSSGAGVCCSGPCNSNGYCEPCGGNTSACEQNTDCCSQNCVNGTCQCYSYGTACTSSQQCCSGLCYENACDSCAPQGYSCATLQCCSGLLCNVVAGSLCETCLLNGNTCTSSSQCCSGNCLDGTCEPACLANGSQCSSPGQCCGDGCSPQGGCFTCGASGSGCSAGWQCCSGTCGGSTGHLCE